MGNNATKESGHGRSRRDEAQQDDGSSDSPDRAATMLADRLLYGGSGRVTRSGRAGESFLSSLGLSDGLQHSADHRRETKEEREARKTERERKARERERERSLREEHVDGGYLVTLGTYTGPEDFSKSIVRQLHVSLRVHCLLVDLRC